MFVVADYGQYTSVDEHRAMYQANKPAGKRFLVLPGQFDGFHGWMVLTSTTTKVAELTAAHTRRRSRIYSGDVRDDG